MKHRNPRPLIYSAAFGFVLVGFAVAASLAHAAANNVLQTVDHVDLNRYQGTWYEIARLPLYWEKQCAEDVTAKYELRSDGKIDVTNRCMEASGKESVSKGTAMLADTRGPASKLKVTFFWPFKGDYWILDLDAEYRWALVGTPDRKSLWILSRTARLDDDVVDRLLSESRSRGFDTSMMIRTKQGR